MTRQVTGQVTGQVSGQVTGQASGQVSGQDQQDRPAEGYGRLARTVVLVGMMGSGKTAVGTALARLLGVPFLDSDDEIVRAAQMSVAEISNATARPFFAPAKAR